MSVETFLILAAVVGIGYPILQAVILRATESVRMELADCGKVLLVAPDISEPHKQFISDMLDDVFSWKFMALATITLPRIAFMPKYRTELDSSDRAFMNRDDVRRFVDLHMKAVMAASPFWTVLFVAVFVLTIVAVILTVSISLLGDLWVDTVKHVSPNVHNNRASLHRLSG